MEIEELSERLEETNKALLAVSEAQQDIVNVLKAQPFIPNEMKKAEESLALANERVRELWG